MRKNSFQIFAKLFIATLIFILPSCAPKKTISPTEKTYTQAEVETILDEAQKQIQNQQVIIELMSQKLRSLGLIDKDGYLKTAAERVPEKEVTGRESWQK